MVSIVVSTYNHSHILPWLLLSLEKQDYKDPFEVLICDDGSTEDIRSVVEEFALRDSLDLSYIWQAPKGKRLAEMRNKGIRAAHGDLLVFLDGDCIVPSHWLSGHVKAHKKNKNMVVGGTRAWVDIDFRKIKTLPQLYRACKGKQTYPDIDRQRQLIKTSSPFAAIWGFNCSVPRHFDLHFDEKIGRAHEDCELFCRLFHRHNFRATLKESLQVLHVSPPKNQFFKPWAGDHESIAQMVQSLLYFEKKYPDLDLTEALWPLHHFQLDKKKWRRSRPGEKISIPRALAIADAWLASASHPKL